MKQIEEEGNDPFLTNQTFGTPHDLAILQMRAKDANNGGDVKKIDFGKMETNAELNYSEHDTDKNAERSPEDGYGQQNHIRGRDPLGSEDYFSPRKPQRSPLSMEGKKRIGLSLIDKKFGEKSSYISSSSFPSFSSSGSSSSAIDCSLP